MVKVWQLICGPPRVTWYGSWPGLLLWSLVWLHVRSVLGTSMLLGAASEKNGSDDYLWPLHRFPPLEIPSSYFHLYLDNIIVDFKFQPFSLQSTSSRDLEIASKCLSLIRCSLLLVHSHHYRRSVSQNPIPKSPEISPVDVHFAVLFWYSLHFAHYLGLSNFREPESGPFSGARGSEIMREQTDVVQN